MKQVRFLDDVVGKTILEVMSAKYNERWMVIFDDDTFSIIGIERGWEAGDEELEDEELEDTDFSRLDWDDSDSLRLGLVSEETLRQEELRKQENKQIDLEREDARELLEYQRLQLKYGDPSP